MNRKSKHRTVTGTRSAKRRLILYTQSTNRRIEVLGADPRLPIVSRSDDPLETIGHATLGTAPFTDIALSGIPCLLAVLYAVSSINRDCENRGFKKAFSGIIMEDALGWTRHGCCTHHSASVLKPGADSPSPGICNTGRKTL